MHCNARAQLRQAIWLLPFGVWCLLYAVCRLLYDLCCTVLAGAQGFADVAVSCLARAAAPHSQQKEDAQGPPLSPNLTWQELQGHTTSAGSSPEKARAGLLGAAFGAAANAFKAIGNPGKSSKGRLYTIQMDMHHILHLSCGFLDMHFNISTGSRTICTLDAYLVDKTATFLRPALYYGQCFQDAYGQPCRAH